MKNPQRHRPLRFFGEPERFDQRDFRAAAGAVAGNRPRPKIGNRRRAVVVFGVELAQFGFGLFFDPIAPIAHRLREAVKRARLPVGVRHGQLGAAIFRNIFQHDFVEQDRHRVQIRGEGVRADAQGFERNRAAARERVNH